MLSYSAEDIEERAEKLYILYRAKRHHDSPALDIQRLHRDLGGTIYLVKGSWEEMIVTDYTLNPATQQWENIRFETHLPYCSERELNTGVVINRNHLFRVAHSIGHLYLHFLPDKSQEPQTVYRLGRSAQQSEAHHFAAALTMPRQAFTHHWHNTTSGDLLKQSELFGTNIFYAHRRAIQLGLIP